MHWIYSTLHVKYAYCGFKSPSANFVSNLICNLVISLWVADHCNTDTLLNTRTAWARTGTSLTVHVIFCQFKSTCIKTTKQGRAFETSKESAVDRRDCVVIETEWGQQRCHLRQDDTHSKERMSYIRVEIHTLFSNACSTYILSWECFHLSISAIYIQISDFLYCKAQ